MILLLLLHTTRSKNSTRFNNFLPIFFPRYSQEKKNLSILQLNSEIPSLLFPPLFLQKKEIWPNSQFWIKFDILLFWKRKKKERNGEERRKEQRTSRDINRTRYEATRAGCFSSRGKIVLRAVKKRGWRKTEGATWYLAGTLERNFLPERFLQNPKEKYEGKRWRLVVETAENCCNAVFLLVERWFRSTRRNHEQGSAMHNGIQGMRTEGVPFFGMSMQIRLFTDENGEKEMDEEGMKFSWKKGDDYGNSRSFFRRIFVIRRVNIYFIRIFL